MTSDPSTLPRDRVRDRSFSSPQRTRPSLAPAPLPAIPVVEHRRVTVGAGMRRRLDVLASELREADPRLEIEPGFRSLRPRVIERHASVHIDDMSVIPLVTRFYDVSFLQHRARLRAGAGDAIVSRRRPPDAYVAYARDQLELGRVTWMHPAIQEDPQGIAAACWRDRSVRTRLLRSLRAGRWRYIHPHIGSFPVWATARLLARRSKAPIEVIAPHPGLAAAVNDKLWLAHVVSRLFGQWHIPPTAGVWNTSTLTRVVLRMCLQAETVVVKLPDSAGGAGNLLLDASTIRHVPTDELRRYLITELRPLGWEGRGPLLVSCWASDVLSSPSAQLWIPPQLDEDPIIEGIYEQRFAGTGFFAGSRPARLPGTVLDEIAYRCWALGRLFQHLGYVGRCSFDLLLAGDAPDRGRLAFIECNGRWGGTSAPMTLMNRLFGDWARAPYAAREVHVPGLEQLGFADLLAALGDEAYDARTGRGRFILYNPHGIEARAGVDAIAIGRSWEEASYMVEVVLPSKLRDLVDRRGIRPRRISRPSHWMPAASRGSR